VYDAVGLRPAAAHQPCGRCLHGVQPGRHGWHAVRLGAAPSGNV